MGHQVVATVLLAVVTAFGSPAAAQTRQGDTITVSGEAMLNVAPDHATVGAGVISRGKTAREASEANNKAMQRLIVALHASGLTDRDIQTEYVSLQPLQEGGRNGGNVHITGFQASNSVSIAVRDIGKVASVLDAAIAAGANEISGITFGISDRSKKLDAARAAAVADARRKATVLAKAAGVELGRPTKIAEAGGSAVGPVAMRAMAATPTPIAPGEQQLRAHVTITFELMH